LFLLLLIGFDEDTLDCHFMALDPERVGIDNVEVPQICDFGDNVLDYMTCGGHINESHIDGDNKDIEDSEDDSEVSDVDDDNFTYDDEDSLSTSSCSSDDSLPDEPSIGASSLTANFIAFLRE
jgi:hypothetical protein